MSRRIADVLEELGVDIPAVMADVALVDVPDSSTAPRTCMPVRDRELRAQKLRGWGAPEMAVRLLLSGDFGRTEALAAAERLVDAAHDGAVWAAISGPVGSGKTLAAAIWLARVRGRGAARAFIASESVATLPANTVTRTAKIEALISASALVLDDVGRHDVVDGKLHPNVQAVLRLRYDARRPTLVTSNQKEPEMIELLGSKLMSSRWGEVGAYEQVQQVVRPRRRA